MVFEFIKCLIQWDERLNRNVYSNSVDIYIKLWIEDYSICTIYNMSGRVVSDIQTRAEGESLYIQYNTDANVVNDLKNDSSYEFIGEVILKINVV